MLYRKESFKKKFRLYHVIGNGLVVIQERKNGNQINFF